jgi:polyhydroxyalkanoate synthase
MGKEPFPFDLLYWNDDSTNMPGKLHSDYLHSMYHDNLLCYPGRMKIAGTPIDVATINTPAYFLSTREDHIAPWKATYEGAKMFTGPVTFTLAASGHIAGVVNAPGKDKYSHQTGSTLPKNPDDWTKIATENKGSWWPHWQKWIAEFTGPEVDTRQPGKGIEPAPGSYVKKKADI